MPENKPENKKDSDQIVLVDGATGYVGSHLVSDLIKQNLTVRCLVRQGAHQDDIDFLSGLGAQVIQTELSKTSTTALAAFRDATAAVHLIGSIAPKRGETFEKIHVEPTANFAALCQRANVPKAIMVTALGTGPEAKSLYHRSKWQAESILRASKIPTIFLRPSLLVGRTIGRRDSKLVKRYIELIRTKKTIPLIGGGTNKLQPLFIDDLVAAIRKTIQTQSGGVSDDAVIYELVGPNIITMSDLVTDLMKVMGIQRRLVNLPIPVANLIAMLAEKTQAVPIISQDQVILSTTDNISQNSHMETVFNIKPCPMNIAMHSYGKGAESLLAARR